jgi:hypothetical protein
MVVPYYQISGKDGTLYRNDRWTIRPVTRSVKELRSKINACKLAGRSLLQRAVYQANVANVQLLISQGACLDTVHEVTKMRMWTKAVQV